MGRLSIFSWSSGKASHASDTSPSWTLISRPQSNATQPGQQRINSARETGPDVPKDTRKGFITSEEAASDSHSSQKENRTQPSGQQPQTNSDVPSSGALEPLTLVGPNTGSFSRRIAGLKTLFRGRRHRRQRLNFTIAKDEVAEDDCVSEGARCSTPTSEETIDIEAKDSQAAVSAQSPNPLKAPIPDDEARKVSDKTEKSVNSNTTNITVCHHPSKRMSMPIIVVDRELAHPNPFDDAWEASRSEASRSETQLSNPFKPQAKTSDSTERSSSGYSGSENPFSSLPGNVLSLSNSSHSSWGCAGFHGWPSASDRQMASEAFNKLASALFLEPLADNKTSKYSYDLEVHWWDLTAVADGLFAASDRLERRRDRLLGRIRIMRSTMHIRSEPAMPRTRNLRRMKTFTALPDRPHLMTSLMNKPLETLARLGGYSYLTLPGDFAPTTLSLPVCFVATINYLRTYATPVQNLFVDPGDFETATQIYHFFAQQVLSAEKDKSKIHMTMRISKMPEFLDDVSRSDETQTSHVLSVGSTFMALLAGLPGGILGSVLLYRTLVNIHHGRISSQSVQRTGSCLAGLSAEDYAKVRAISLALVALTSSMQLNLICGVFGLCSLLIHETERMLEIERRQRRVSRRIYSNADKLSLDRFAATLAPLLIETGLSDETHAFQAIHEEIESQRVVTLLIKNWRSVSRQLRIWERRGLEGRVQARAHARAASGDSEKAVEMETQQRDCI
ncbi:uncharacterized protein DSM5745_10208 [Aspergillus mulundensis]|uniref:Uncharacterized protein n=1 Tax=Aspergillus mulundensis TaxID=1810919 RepID=A0A3D8QMT9_9EURO|nr:Uncharacterized protein DSM5745_10208 [Aspergillus mulundensis]RDW63097.1 Uncharacterized protein DSM5745_10208 [Aspergillus mulundensis]